jgi:hypothetical protein
VVKEKSYKVNDGKQLQDYGRSMTLEEFLLHRLPRVFQRFINMEGHEKSPEMGIQ